MEQAIMTQINEFIKFTNGKEAKCGNYILSISHGVEEIIKDDPDHSKLVFERPIYISKIIDDYDNGEKFVEISFMKEYADKEFTKIELPLSVILSHKKIHEPISKYGFNFTEKKSYALVDFFQAFLVMNEGNIPKTKMYSKMGWKNNFTSFVIGKKEYFADNKVDDILFNTNKLDNNILDALNSKGTIIEWHEMIRPFIQYDTFRTILYVGGSSPLLSLLDQDTRLFNSNGPSGKGKTLRNMIGNSEWGNSELQISADNTPTYYERVMAAMQNIPVNFDDTSAINPKYNNLSQIIYMLGNNHGKGRGKKEEGEVCKSSTWRTIALVSGEKPLTNHASLSGEKVRGIDDDSEIPRMDPQVIQKFYDDLKDCHGVYAPLLVRYIMNNQSQIKNKYIKCVKEISDSLNIKDNNTADRMAKSFGIFLLSGYIFEEIMEINVPGYIKKDPLVVIKSIAKNIIENIVNKPTHIEALKDVAGWIDTNRKFFKIQGEFMLGKEEREPNTYYGNWRSKSRFEVMIWTLRDALKKHGFDYDAVIKEWKKEEIIWTDDEGRIEQRTTTFGFKDGNKLNNGKTLFFNPEKILEKYNLELISDPATKMRMLGFEFKGETSKAPEKSGAINIAAL